MLFSTEDKYTIKVLREQKHYGATKILRMFPNVHDLVLSQDDKPKTQSNERQIARQTGVSLGLVN